MQEAIGKIVAMPAKPAFMIHTGDISHLSKPKQFDDADQAIGEASLDVHYVPGEHDVIDETQGKAYLERYGKNAKGAGWYSFDQAGVHFIGLVNVVDLKAGGMGNLGAEQLAWLADDLAGKSASTPIVVFAHIPLWTIAPEWGWGTQDSAQALSLLARFGSVTVLNGHIHQFMQKVEGDVTFHTARSTAFPQPAPGTAPAPGPMLVPAGELRGLLGVQVRGFPAGRERARRHRRIARLKKDNVDVRQIHPAAAPPATRPRRPRRRVLPVFRHAFSRSGGRGESRHRQFRLHAGGTLTVKPGATVIFDNHDDIPHLVVAVDGKYRSKALDTNDKYSVTFDKPGEYAYFCGLHPHMKGKIVVAP